MHANVKLLLTGVLVGLLAFSVYGQQIASTKTVDGMLTTPSKQFLPLADALLNLEKEYNVSIVFDDATVQGKMAPRLAMASTSFQEALRQVLGPNPLAYTKVGYRTVVLSPAKAQPAMSPAPNDGTIKGKITV